MTKSLLCAVLAVASVVCAPAMAAHDLTPGDNGSPLASPLPTGTGMQIADTGIQNYSAVSGRINLDVMMRAAVYRSVARAADAAALGLMAGDSTLDFVYQVTNKASSNTSINTLTFADFALGGTPFKVLAWDSLTGFDVFSNGQEEADSASRSFDGSVLRGHFGTNFFANVNAGANQLLNPGETSSVFLFRVNATRYQSGTFTAQNGLTINGLGYSPLAGVPEPAGWAMMIVGFGLAGGALRTRARMTARAAA